MERNNGRPNDGPYITFFNKERGLAPAPHFKDDKTTEYEFSTGTRSRGNKFYLYHQELPLAKNVRTSLAILSKFRADEVFVMIEDNVKRPVIGIRKGNKFYFSIHAGAFPANPSHETVEHIEKFLKQRLLSSGSFIIMGDFNKIPPDNNPTPVLGMSIKKIAPKSPTQLGGKTLDYAFIGSNGIQNLPDLSAEVLTNGSSDHYIVLFKN